MFNNIVFIFFSLHPQRFKMFIKTIYVLKDDGMYKIGYTKDLTKRLATYSYYKKQIVLKRLKNV
jgi:predicted GIY-YIG superfamily endonuclease